MALFLRLVYLEKIFALLDGGRLQVAEKTSDSQANDLHFIGAKARNIYSKWRDPLTVNPLAAFYENESRLCLAEFVYVEKSTRLLFPIKNLLQVCWDGSL